MPAPYRRRARQNGGHGMAGQPSPGSGKRPVASSLATRSPGARAISRAAEQLGQHDAEPVRPRSSRAARGRRRPRAASGRPAQPHSTVRSFSSSLKVTPWSTPSHDRAVGERRRTCPPLRSALLTTASKTAIRRRSASSACTSVTGLAVVTVGVEDLEPAVRDGAAAPRRRRDHRRGPCRRRRASTHSCAMPCPNGPSSRQTVGGTTSQPSGRGDLVRRDLAQAQGAVGEVPERPLARDRLVDAGDAAPLELGAGEQRRVATRRRAGPRRSRRLRRRGPRAESVSGGHRERSASVAVGARADVAHGSSGWPQKGQGGRPADTTELARLANARAAAPVRRTRSTVGPSLGSSSRSGASASSSSTTSWRLDDDELGVAVPAERHGADPELLGDRRVERVECPRCPAAPWPGPVPLPGAADDLVEQRVDPLGEDLHLLLLQRDRDDPRAVARLKEERAARPGWPTVPATNRSGWSKRKTCRATSTLSRRPRRRRPRPSGWESLDPAPPPTTASDEALRLRRLAFGGGTSEDRSPPVSLVRSTNGRRSV